MLGIARQRRLKGQARSTATHLFGAVGQTLLFSAAQVGTEPFRAMLAEICGEPSLGKTDSRKMLQDIEAEPGTVLPARCARAISSIS